MPIDYHYNPDKRALYGVMSGDLSVQEYTDVGKDIVSSDLHPPDIRSIWDLTALNFSATSRGLLENLILVRASLPERHSARIAFVVADELGLGMSRMFEIIGEDLGDETRVFLDYSEAEEWLLWEES